MLNDELRGETSSASELIIDINSSNLISIPKDGSRVGEHAQNDS